MPDPSLEELVKVLNAWPPNAAYAELCQYQSEEVNAMNEALCRKLSEAHEAVQKAQLAYDMATAALEEAKAHQNKVFVGARDQSAVCMPELDAAVKLSPAADNGTSGAMAIIRQQVEGDGSTETVP